MSVKDVQTEDESTVYNGYKTLPSVIRFKWKS